MSNLLLVGAGGALGAIARYVLAGKMQRTFPGFLPAGTLAVNVLGCLLIGMMFFLVERRPGTPAQLFLTTGVLGGFTTFSAFGFETVELLNKHETRLAFLNIAGNLVLGLAAVWLGRWLAKVLAG